MCHGGRWAHPIGRSSLIHTLSVCPCRSHWLRFHSIHYDMVYDYVPRKSCHRAPQRTPSFSATYSLEFLVSGFFTRWRLIACISQNALLAVFHFANAKVVADEQGRGH